MGSAFHFLCPRYSGTLIPTTPMAIRLQETFTLFFFTKKRTYSNLTDGFKSISGWWNGVYEGLSALYNEMPYRF